MSLSVTKTKELCQKEELYFCLGEEALIISDVIDTQMEKTILNPVNLFASPINMEGS